MSGLSIACLAKDIVNLANKGSAGEGRVLIQSIKTIEFIVVNVKSGLTGTVSQ